MRWDLIIWYVSNVSSSRKFLRNFSDIPVKSYFRVRANFLYVVR